MLWLLLSACIYICHTAHTRCTLVCKQNRHAGPLPHSPHSPIEKKSSGNAVHFSPMLLLATMHPFCMHACMSVHAHVPGRRLFIMHHAALPGVHLWGRPTCCLVAMLRASPHRCLVAMLRASPHRWFCCSGPCTHAGMTVKGREPGPVVPGLMSLQAFGGKPGP